MLDVQELKASAEKAFKAAILDKVEHLADGCWVQNLNEHRINEINRILQAGRKMEVTEAEDLDKEKSKELLADLTTLKSLEMISAAREHIQKTLIDVGVDPAIFNK